MDFSVKHQSLQDGVFVLLPEGSIDSFSSEAFGKALQSLLKPQTKAILLDMGKVKYISSVGLGALISAMKKSKDNACGFWVYDTQLSVKRVLEISKLDFLELTLNTLDAQSPYIQYIRTQEPERQKRREAEDSQKKKREAEIADRIKKEKAVS